MKKEYKREIALLIFGTLSDMGVVRSHKMEVGLNRREVELMRHMQGVELMSHIQAVEQIHKQVVDCRQEVEQSYTRVGLHGQLGLKLYILQSVDLLGRDELGLLEDVYHQHNLHRSLFFVALGLKLSDEQNMAHEGIGYSNRGTKVRVDSFQNSIDIPKLCQQMRKSRTLTCGV